MELSGLVSLLSEIIETILNVFHIIMANVVPNDVMDTLIENSFNIYLFSDSGWFTQPILLVDLLYLVLFILLLVFLVRLIWKATKKFINVVFGVFRI